MLPLNTRFHVNDAEVTAEVFDGEAIILNIATGAYYSMDKVGGLAWTLIAKGHSLSEVMSTLVARYDVAPEQVGADVARLAEELVQERLVLVTDRVRSLDPSEAPASGPRLEYTPPALRVYRDMAAMLALDPPMPRLDEIPWKESGDDPRP